MSSAVRQAEARRLTRLPDRLHHTGEPTAWTRMTRPGQRLHSFLEGLIFDAEGAAYLVDVPHGRILRVSPDHADWQVAFQYDGEPHGLAFAPDGGLVISDYRRGLLRLDLGSGSLEVLCNGFGGENFRGLSDIAYDPDGALWFTDSGRTSLSDPTGRLFRLDRDGVLDCILDCVPYPNGLAFSADGAFVYLAATRANAVWRLARTRKAGAGRAMSGLYAQFSGGLGPDGLAVSPDGWLAVAHAQAGRVWLLDRRGDVRWRIDTPGGDWTTSVRFGGPEGRTLFIVDAQSGSLLACDIPAEDL